MLKPTISLILYLFAAPFLVSAHESGPWNISARDYTAEVSQQGFNLHFLSTDRGDFSVSELMYGRENGPLNLISGLEIAHSTQDDNGLVLHYENGLSAEYFNAADGFRFNYIINNRPSGNGDFIFRFSLATPYSALLEGNDINFYKNKSSESRMQEITNLKVWDANGTLVDFVTQIEGHDGNYIVNIIFSDENLQYPLVIDPLFRSLVLSALMSDDAGGQFGKNIAFADVNDDGYDDIVSAAPLYDKGITGDGAVFVYLANEFGVNPVPVFKKLSDAAGEMLGCSIANAGDVNDDGYQDIIVGADNWYTISGGYAQPETGRAFMLYGCSYGIDTTNIQEIIAPDFQSRFGYSVVGLGDVNGDEYDDILISALHYPYFYANKGKILLYYGSAAGLSPTPGWTIEGTDMFNHAGQVISKAGDVNADGFADFIISQPYNETDEMSAGRINLYYGSPAGPSDSPGYIYEGHKYYGCLGISVGGGMDLNKDGYDDFLVGAFGEGTYCSGIIRAFYGSASGPVMNWQKNGLFYMSGGHVSTAGDFNGDGFDDAIYSAGGMPGGAGDCTSSSDDGFALYLGGTSGLKNSPAWTNRLYENDNLGFGNSLAGKADINTDGFEDFIVGVPNFNAPEVGSGAVFIYYGSASMNIINQLPDTTETVKSIFTEHFYGDKTICYTDIDNNGYTDLIMGDQSYPYFYLSPGAVAVYRQFADGFEKNPSYLYTAAPGSNHALGITVKALGDINSDGYNDFVAGAKNYNDGMGALFIFFGGASGVNTALSPQIIEAPDGHGALGGSVTVSDVNGDGKNDIVAGAVAYGPTYYVQGSAVVYFGDDTGINDTPDSFLNGSDYFQYYGENVADVGDVNNDGYNDVAVSSYMYDNYLFRDYGRVQIYPGSPDGLLNTPISDISGVFTYQYLGSNVWKAGDVNSDGYDDVLMTSKASPGYSFFGNEVRLYYGSETGIQEDNYWKGTGSQPTYGYGDYFAGNGDYNGDGYNDIILGHPQYVGATNNMVGYTTDNTGGIYVYYGSYKGLGNPNKIIEVDTNSVDNMGFNVTLLPDENGDGKPDLITFATKSSYFGTDSLTIQKYYSQAVICSPVSSVTSSALLNSISLSWSGNKLDLNYILKWKKHTDTIWNDTLLVNPEVNFAGLDTCTAYDFIIQKNCESGSSFWSDTIALSTSGCTVPCNSIIIENISASSVSGSGATISWDISPYAIQYEISIKKQLILPGHLN